MENQTSGDEVAKEEIVEEKVEAQEEVEAEVVAEESEGEESQEDEYKSKYYYLAAEFENAKKRFQREKESLLKYGHEKVLSGLIEVIDNFERVAMALNGDDDPKVKNLKIGIDMVHKQLVDNLADHGLTAIEAVGEEFDPNIHEAMGQEKAEGAKEQEIIREMLKGYKLNGRVIRASKVIVAQNEETEKESKGE